MLKMNGRTCAKAARLYSEMKRRMSVLPARLWSAAKGRIRASYCTYLWGPAALAYLWLLERLGPIYAPDVALALGLSLLAVLALAPAWAGWALFVIQLLWQSNRDGRNRR